MILHYTGRGRDISATADKIPSRYGHECGQRPIRPDEHATATRKLEGEELVGEAAQRMDFLDVDPVKALFWTAVINGVLAPFLLVGVLMAASDRKLMQGQPSSWLSRIAVGVITLVMFGAAAAMFIL